MDGSCAREPIATAVDNNKIELVAVAIDGIALLHTKEHTEESLHAKYSSIGWFNHEACTIDGVETLVYTGRHTPYFTKRDSDDLIKDYIETYNYGITKNVDFDRAAANATIGVYLRIAQKILSDVKACRDMSPEELFKTFFILYNQVFGECDEECEDDYPLEHVFESIFGLLSEGVNERAIQYAFSDYHTKQKIIKISRRIVFSNAENSLSRILSISRGFFHEKSQHEFEKRTKSLQSVISASTRSFYDSNKMKIISHLNQTEMNKELLNEFKIDGPEIKPQFQKIADCFTQKLLRTAHTFLIDGCAKFQTGLDAVIALLLELHQILTPEDSLSNFESCVDDPFAKIQALLESINILLSSKTLVSSEDFDKLESLINTAMGGWTETLNACMCSSKFQSGRFATIDYFDPKDDYYMKEIPSIEDCLIHEFVELSNTSRDAIEAYDDTFDVLNTASNNCTGEDLNFSGDFSNYMEPISRMGAKGFAIREFSNFFKKLVFTIVEEKYTSVEVHLQAGRYHTAICTALDLVQETDFSAISKSHFLPSSESRFKRKSIKEKSADLMCNVINMTHSGVPTESSQYEFFEFVKFHKLMRMPIKVEGIKASVEAMSSSSVVSTSSKGDPEKVDTIVSYVKSQNGSSLVGHICSHIDDKMIEISASAGMGEIEASLNFLVTLFTQIDELEFSLLSNKSIKAIKHTGGRLLGSIAGLLNTLNSSKELEPEPKVSLTEMSILKILTKAIELFQKLPVLTATDDNLEPIVAALKYFGESVKIGLNK
jgi:hypothetical protein